MAAIQLRNGVYRVLFRHAGKQYAYTLGKVSKREAEKTADNAEFILMRLKQGLLALPVGVDIVAFIQHGGNTPVTNDGQAVERRVLTLGGLRDRYLETHSNGSLEERTLDGIRLHFKHLVRVLGESFPIRDLALEHLQNYVDRRAKAKGHRGWLSPATIRKEIVTLRTAWNWGVKMRLVSGRFPSDGLCYPKLDEKPPFQTRTEIERQVLRVSEGVAAELWESLYLRKPEIDRLLECMAERAAHGWIYPMVATAAHTGARRSELLRMRVADVDFEAGDITIRERKRQKGKRTSRRVPMSSGLICILRDWLSKHPGGPHLFCPAEQVERSRTRSRMTGYQSSRGRPTTVKARRANLRVRERPGLLALTEDEAHDHFKRTLAGTEWAVVRGYHVLRHSFISALASAGVDQRIIDDFVGHQTDEQRRRYRHLYPSVVKNAITNVFG